MQHTVSTPYTLPVHTSARRAPDSPWYVRVLIWLNGGDPHDESDPEPLGQLDEWDRGRR